MLLSRLPLPDHFTHPERRLEQMLAVCHRNADIAEIVELGKSEEGREITGFVLGTGVRTVSLIAGNHSDEPVGPETLRTFIVEGLRHRERLAGLFDQWRFVVVPHVNPDGEARNAAWVQRWPSTSAYLTSAFREIPGRDIEFGYPDMRPENRAVAGFLTQHAPFTVHGSLHGMGFSDGALLLLDRHWGYRATEIRKRWAEKAIARGLALHDHNRCGEKGFFYLGPGYQTTPEGEAMRSYFTARGEDATAVLFHQSSMELVRSFGGDPLCFVTELPLFVVPRGEASPGVPSGLLAFRERLPDLKLRALRGEPVEEDPDTQEIRVMRIADAVALQLDAIELALWQAASGMPVRVESHAKTA